ncbi:unnamed protein product [Rhizophagus irregularis]|nr:unnamed protein product [Rhizophagus irregularis]
MQRNSLTEGVNTAWVKNLSDIVNELNNSNTRLLDYQGRRRATDPIWSTKVYTIESSTVVDGQPVIYRLSDGPKKIFTREELLVVPSDTMLPPTHILY